MDIMNEDEEDGGNIEITDPQITSTNPVERKLARKLRIQRRLDAVRKLNLPPGEVEPEVIELSHTEQQIDATWELCQKKIFAGEDYITNLRVATDSREAVRRKESVIDRKRAVTKIEDEAALAEGMYRNITRKWPSLVTSNDPLFIHNELANQKALCDELIRQKDGIISMLRNELAVRDIRFAQDQRKQREDLKSLSNRVDKQCLLMRKTFRRELNLIEQAIMLDRLILLDKNKKNWEQLHSDLDHEEESNLISKMEHLYEQQDEMHGLMLKHQERFRETKIHLGSDIETLQKELQKLRASCLLNGEKLDYNYQVLKRREDENIIMKSQQKRRINKLQDVVNRIKSKTADLQKSSDVEIGKLTDEVMKLHSNILDIESKADHFTKVNDKKYRQIWDLNREDAQTLLQKILDIDRILFEQQLGLDWLPPEKPYPNPDELPSYRSAMQCIAELYESKDTKKSTDVPPETDEVAKGTLLRRLLRLVANRSGFLIEHRLKSLLSPYTENERTLIRLDNVFAALNVFKDTDIELLLEYFIPYAYCPICSTDTKKEIISADSETEIRVENMEPSSDYAREVTNTVEQQKTLSDMLSLVHQPEAILDDIVTSFIDESRSEMSIDTGGVRFADGDTSGNILTIQVSDELDHPPSISGSTKPATHRSSSKVSFGSVNACVRSKPERPKTKVRCNANHTLSISAAYILRGLREFATNFNTSKENEVVTMATRLSKKRSTVSRIMTYEDVKIFWERFREIFSPKREKLWDGILVGLNKYHAILKDRQRLSDETKQLRQQNREFRQLLKNMGGYTDSKFLPPLDAYSSMISSAVSSKSSESYKYPKPKV